MQSQQSVRPFDKFSLTVLDTFSHVFLRRKTTLLLKAAQICSTPLKLCRQRAMSATAAHFSMAATRAEMLGRRTISLTTKEDICVNEGEKWTYVGQGKDRKRRGSRRSRATHAPG